MLISYKISSWKYSISNAVHTCSVCYFSSLNTVITPTEIPSVQDLLYRNTSSPSCLHSLKWSHVREQLDTFAAIASASKGGRIGIEEFAEYLKLPISDVLKELFLLFDRVSNWLTDLLTMFC